MPTTGARTDPYRSQHFSIEIDGISRASFSDCSGLDSANDVIQYREGNEPPTTRKLPGLVKYSNIVLKWGTTDDAELWNWRQKVVDGNIERKNASIVLLDETLKEVIRWNLNNVWPSRWVGPPLSASGTSVAVETLELAYEGVKRA
jgi:phage tail-like protein